MTSIFSMFIKFKVYTLHFLCIYILIFSTNYWDKKPQKATSHIKWDTKVDETELTA